MVVAAVLIAGIAKTSDALATTQIPATTYTQNTTWTAAGSPYVINGNVTVGSGVTLTIEPGVIVKFAYQLANPKKIVVAPGGVLSAAGTAASPITFTSIKDDAVGGDTGGDGPTTCVASDGGYIESQSSSPLNLLAKAALRCGPYGQGKTNAPVRVTGTGSALTVTDVDVTQLHGSGFYVAGGTLTLARINITNPASMGVMVGLNGTADVEDITVVGTNTTGSTGCSCGHGIRVEDGNVRVKRSTHATCSSAPTSGSARPRPQPHRVSTTTRSETTATASTSPLRSAAVGSRRCRSFRMGIGTTSSITVGRPRTSSS